MLSAGTDAPNIKLEDQEGNSVDLSGLRGKWVALWWFPKASTPG